MTDSINVLKTRVRKAESLEIQTKHALKKLYEDELFTKSLIKDSIQTLRDTISHRKRLEEQLVNSLIEVTR